MSLLTRVLLVLVLALMPAFAIQFINERAWRQTVEQSAREIVLRDARVLNAELHRHLEGVRSFLVALATVPSLRSPDPVACSALLDKFLRRFAVPGTLTYVGPDGHVVCAATAARATEAFVGDQPHFRLPVERGDFVVGGYVPGRDRKLVGMGYAVRADDGAGLHGVLMAELELSWLARGIDAWAGSPGARVIVADRDGRLLVHLPDAQRAGEMLADSDRWLLATPPEGAVELVGSDGVRRIVGYAAYDTQPRDLFVSLGYSTDTAYAASRAASRQGYALLAVACAVAMLLAFLAARRSITAPVQGILQAVDGWRAGRRDVGVNLSSGGGEIARTARAVDALIEADSRNATALTALRASEARLSLVEDAIGLGTFDWNVATDELCWSPQQYVLHGLAPVAGQAGPTIQQWLNSVHPDDRAAARRAYAAAREGRRGYLAEYRVVDPAAGAVRWVATRARVFLDAEGRPARVVGVNYDVTERRFAENALADANAALERRVAERTARLEAEMHERQRAEAELLQAKKMEALGQLTGGIAHDFNNLLTAVNGNLELALRHVADQPALARLLDGALRAADRGTTLTRRMLAFARRQQLHLQPVDLAKLVAGMDNLLARSIGPAITVSSNVPDTVWSVRADPNQLELVLLNLAINARDAMPEGGQLTLAAANETRMGDDGTPGPRDRGDYVRISVTDSGLGMEETVLARAFEPFFTTKPAGKGSGLGLSMVHGVAMQSGGAVHVDSTPGQGTTVTLWLPRAEPEAVVAPARAPGPAPAMASAGACILLVEDDPDVAEFAAACLESVRYRVLRAADGSRALEVLQNGCQVDALVADFAMPGMTGTDLAVRARALRPGLPVLLVTGYADAADEDGVFAGLPMLGKPFRAQQLCDRVAALLAGRT